jgi:AraC family transcriptional regulator
MEQHDQPSHYERINAIKRYIREHLDEPLGRDLLAGLAGFSVPHFHRIFAAHVGESIASYVRRARMERAAQQILAGAASITAIAADSGYETHSAFTKAFRQHFGISPAELRALDRVVAAHVINRHVVYYRREPTMQPMEIRTLPDTQVLYARATEVMTSPAFQTANGEAFGKLMGFLSEHQLTAQMQACIAIYPDEVEIGKPARFDAGAIFADGVAPAATGGLAYQTLPGGRWAIFRHIGPYENLWQTWRAALRDWLPTSGQEMRDAIPYEVYVDAPSVVAPEQLRTDIYIPIR